MTIYNLRILIFSFFFLVGSWEGSEDIPMFWQGSMSLGVINWRVFSSQGPSSSLARGWLLQSHFFVIATTTGCYDDKATCVSTSSEIMLPGTIISFWFLQEQSPGHFVVIK